MADADEDLVLLWTSRRYTKSVGLRIETEKEREKTIRNKLRRRRRLPTTTSGISTYHGMPQDGDILARDRWRVRGTTIWGGVVSIQVVRVSIGR